MDIFYQFLESVMGKKVYPTYRDTQLSTIGRVYRTAVLESALNPNFPTALPVHRGFPLPISTAAGLHYLWLRSEKVFRELEDLVYFSALIFNVPFASQYLLGREDLEREGYQPQDLALSRRHNPCAEKVILAPTSAFSCQETENPLRRIGLELTMGEFVNFFNVTVPPFGSRTWLESDWYAEYQHAGQVLQSIGVEELTLCFGQRFREWDAWGCLDSILFPEWHEYRPQDTRCPWEACCRAPICSKGLIVDWILSYGWQRGYLKGIRKISLEGDIQGWVREKWEDVFERGSVDPALTYAVNLRELETIGREDWMTDEDWEVAQPNFYPPYCDCEKKCRESQWDEKRDDEAVVELVFEPVPVIGDWDSDRSDGEDKSIMW